MNIMVWIRLVSLMHVLEFWSLIQWNLKCLEFPVRSSGKSLGHECPYEGIAVGVMKWVKPPPLSPVICYETATGWSSLTSNVNYLDFPVSRIVIQISSFSL